MYHCPMCWFVHGYPRVERVVCDNFPLSFRQCLIKCTLSIPCFQCTHCHLYSLLFFMLAAKIETAKHNICNLTDFTVGTNLEVVSKGPVSQHFKECVMVDIFADIIQIIVLSPCPDTFLRVGCTHILSHVTVGINNLQKDGLKLKKNKYVYWK